MDGWNDRWMDGWMSEFEPPQPEASASSSSTDCPAEEVVT